MIRKERTLLTSLSMRIHHVRSEGALRTSAPPSPSSATAARVAYSCSSRNLGKPSTFQADSNNNNK